ncbi:MAG: matrixin family metalloprotease, partial [Planctomycetota bacterium]|nr:matrixin family metalloprotease [Planctomycetota bacterium]
MKNLVSLGGLCALGATGLALSMADFAGSTAITARPVADVDHRTCTHDVNLDDAAIRAVVEDEHHHPTLCVLFAPGTPMEYVNEVMQQLYLNAGMTRFVQQGSTWFPAGSGGTLTYSFPADGLNIPNGIGEGNGPNTLNATLQSEIGGPSQWKPLFDQSFGAWAEFTALEYQEVSDDNANWGAAGNANRGDVRIAMKQIDGTNGVLAYNNFPSGGGDMVLDEDENWGSTFQNFRFFRNIIMHEHGHGLGIAHVCPANQTKLMEPFLSTAYDGPQHDEVRAGTFLYGDRFEPNGSAASA